MVQINFAQKQVSAKIVYYGPGMSGKTTNLEIVHQKAPDQNKGDLTSISTDGDRTLFFDFMPLDLGTVAGMRTCFQIYTVPGQVYYNSTRKLVLQGVDGVVFVADSSAAMMQENLESLRNLEENLNEYGKSLATMAHVIQFNKRDLPDALPVEELNQLLNPYGAPCFEAIANTGQGVFPTLKALAARVLEVIHSNNGAPASAAPATPRTAPAPQRAPLQPARPQQAQRPITAVEPPAPLPQPQQFVQSQPIQQPPPAVTVAAAMQRTGFHAAAGAAPQQPHFPTPQPLSQTGFAQRQGAPLGQTGFAQRPQVQQPQGMPMQQPPQAMPQQPNYGAPQGYPQMGLPQQQPVAGGWGGQPAPTMGMGGQQAYGAAAMAPQPQMMPGQAPSLAQTGFHNQTAISSPSAQQPGAGLQMAGRASTHLPNAAVPTQRPMAAPVRPMQQAPAPVAPRQVPGPLEGSRFDPRRQAAPTPAPTPRATPTGEGSNKLYIGLFIGAGVILVAGLTYVVLSFL